MVALVVPAGTGGLVASLVELAIRGYRRWLTRFTPACPSEPSCSAYALAAVTTLGAPPRPACGGPSGAQLRPPSMRPTMRST